MKMAQSNRSPKALECPWILEGKTSVDGWLDELIAGQADAFLGALLKKAVFPGRRIRPALLVKLSDARRDVSRDALILELFHASSIVVDDLLDGDDGRREIANSILKVGSESVLVSHFLSSAAWGLALRAHRTTEVHAAYSRMCKGEFSDIFSVRPKADWKFFYSDQVLEKTTPLFELAFIWGLEDQAEVSVARARDLGNRLGALFQMSNDIFDITRVARAQRNAINYKYPLSVTLPLACFLDGSSSHPFKEQILQAEDRLVLLKGDIEALDETIVAGGFRDEAIRIFQDSMSSFRKALSEIAYCQPWLEPFLAELRDYSLWTKDYELIEEGQKLAGTRSPLV
jgi:geranylgeranyl pyrophosphate synthase